LNSARYGTDRQILVTVGARTIEFLVLAGLAFEKLRIRCSRFARVSVQPGGPEGKYVSIPLTDRNLVGFSAILPPHPS